MQYSIIRRYFAWCCINSISPGIDILLEQILIHFAKTNSTFWLPQDDKINLLFSPLAIAKYQLLSEAGLHDKGATPLGFAGEKALDTINWILSIWHIWILVQIKTMYYYRGWEHSWLLLLQHYVTRSSSRPVSPWKLPWPFTPGCPTPVSKSQLHRGIPPPPFYSHSLTVSWVAVDAICFLTNTDLWSHFLLKCIKA